MKTCQRGTERVILGKEQVFSNLQFFKSERLKEHRENILLAELRETVQAFVV